MSHFCLKVGDITWAFTVTGQIYTDNININMTWQFNARCAYMSCGPALRLFSRDRSRCLQKLEWQYHVCTIASGHSNLGRVDVRGPALLHVQQSTRLQALLFHTQSFHLRPSADLPTSADQTPCTLGIFESSTAVCTTSGCFTKDLCDSCLWHPAWISCVVGSRRMLNLLCSEKWIASSHFQMFHCI